MLRVFFIAAMSALFRSGGCQGAGRERLDIVVAVDREASYAFHVNCAYSGGGSVATVQLLRKGLPAATCNVSAGKAYSHGLPYDFIFPTATGCEDFSSKVAQGIGATLSVNLRQHNDENADYQCRLTYKTADVAALVSATRWVTLSLHPDINITVSVISSAAVAFACSYSWSVPLASLTLTKDSVPVLKCNVGSAQVVKLGDLASWPGVTMDGCSGFDTAWQESGKSSVSFTVVNYQDVLQGAYRCRAALAVLHYTVSNPTSLEQNLLLTRVAVSEISTAIISGTRPGIAITCAYSGGSRVTSVSLLKGQETLLRCVVGSSVLQRYSVAKSLKDVTAVGWAEFPAALQVSGRANVSFRLGRYNDTLRGFYSCRFSYQDADNAPAAITSERKPVLLTIKPAVDLAIVMSGVEMSVNMTCLYSGGQRPAYISLLKGSTLALRCYSGSQLASSLISQWSHVATVGCQDSHRQWLESGHSSVTFIVTSYSDALIDRYQCKADIGSVSDHDPESVRSVFRQFGATDASQVGISTRIVPGATTGVTVSCSYSGRKRVAALDVVRGLSLLLRCGVDAGVLTTYGAATGVIGIALRGCDKFLSTWQTGSATAVSFFIPEFKDRLRGDYRCRAVLVDTASGGGGGSESGIAVSEYKSLLLTESPMVDIDIQPFFDAANAVALTCTYSGTKNVTRVDLTKDSGAVLGCSVGSQTLASSGVLSQWTSVTMKGCTKFADNWLQSGESKVTFTITNYQDTLRGAYQCKLRLADDLGVGTVMSSRRSLLLTRDGSAKLTARRIDDAMAFTCTYAGMKAVALVNLYKYKAPVMQCDIGASTTKPRGNSFFYNRPGLTINGCGEQFTSSWRESGVASVTFVVAGFGIELSDGYRCRAFFSAAVNHDDHVASGWTFATVASDLSLFSLFEPYEGERNLFTCVYKNPNNSLYEIALLWNGVPAAACAPGNGTEVPAKDTITHWSAVKASGCDIREYEQVGADWRSVTFTYFDVLVDHSGSYRCRARAQTDEGRFLSAYSQTLNVVVNANVMIGIRAPTSSPSGSTINIRCSYQMLERPTLVRIARDGVALVTCMPDGRLLVTTAMYSTYPTVTSNDCNNTASRFTDGRGFFSVDLHAATSNMSGNYTCVVSTVKMDSAVSEKRQITIYDVNYCRRQQECSHWCTVANASRSCTCPEDMALGSDGKTCEALLPVMLDMTPTVAADSDIAATCTYTSRLAVLVTITLITIEQEIAKCTLSTRATEILSATLSTTHSVVIQNCLMPTPSQLPSVVFVIKSVRPSLSGLYRCVAEVADKYGIPQQIVSTWEETLVTDDITIEAAERLLVAEKDRSATYIGVGAAIVAAMAGAAVGLIIYLKRRSEAGVSGGAAAEQPTAIGPTGPAKSKRGANNCDPVELTDPAGSKLAANIDPR